MNMVWSDCGRSDSSRERHGFRRVKDTKDRGRSRGFRQDLKGASRTTQLFHGSVLSVDPQRLCLRFSRTRSN